jgi:hypothetical protein
MTSLSVGSLLDDNIWHDVVISRNRKDIMFSVDRVQIRGRIKGEFYRLNLNRGVSILMKLHLFLFEFIFVIAISECTWALFLLHVTFQNVFYCLRVHYLSK